MLTFLQSLTPEQQAVLVGLVVAALGYLLRLVRPAWFEGADSVSKFQRTATTVLASGLAALATFGGKPPEVGAFLLAWFLAYSSAEGAHTLAARATAMR